MSGQFLDVRIGCLSSPCFIRCLCVVQLVYPRHFPTTKLLSSMNCRVWVYSGIVLTTTTHEKPGHQRKKGQPSNASYDTSGDGADWRCGVLYRLLCRGR